MDTSAKHPSIDQALEFQDYSPEHLSALKKPLNALSTAQAVTLIGQIHREIENVEDYLLRLRWCLGFVLAHTERPFGSAGTIIEEIIRELWDQHQIRAYRTLLYECERLYHVFAGDFPAFLQWIAEQKAILGRPVRWADIRRLCLGGRNNPDVIGREAADEQDYRDAEQGVEAIERIMDRARNGNEEAQGVIEGIRQSIAGLLLQSNGRQETPRSDEYRGFVRGHPCVVCKRPADAHHAFGRRGVGLKSSDFTSVPLCRVHHVEMHRKHRAIFEAEHRVDLMEVAFNLLHRYVTGAWVTMMLDERRPDQMHG